MICTICKQDDHVAADHDAIQRWAEECQREFDAAVAVQPTEAQARHMRLVAALYERGAF